jgi:hypothetical protein
MFKRGLDALIIAITAVAPALAAESGVAAGAQSGVAPAAQSSVAPAAQSAVAPFSAHYQANWKNISVGTSDLELQQDSQPDHYIYTWTISARGIFRIVYSSDVTQKSWFALNAGHIRPMKYRAVEGSSRVNLDFDWDSGHARGVSENKPVDLKLKEGTQDVMSIQVEVMQDLKNGNLPKTFLIVDKDEVKEFIYAQEGTAKIKTAIGELDTMIVSSRRTGGNRILRMWFAPSLGFVPVQAERTRDGALEFAMRIKSLKH